MKTILFEKEVGEDISRFRTMKEVELVIEKKIGRPLTVYRVDNPGLISRKGNVFKMERFNLGARLERALKSH